MTIRLVSFLVILALTAPLSSCGFKLRDGSYQLPAEWKQLEVETRGSVSPGSGLTMQLKQILRQAHGTKARSATLNKRPGIILLDEEFRNTVSSLDNLGRAQDYLLEYIVRFQFIGSAGKALAPPHRIYLRTEQAYSSTSILAKEHESEYLRKKLQQRAASRIVQRLLATLR